MNMKHINKIGVLLTAGMALSAVSCTDYSDYNSSPADTQSDANMTLWENITADGQLTKFAGLARKCNYMEVLNTPHFYTLWAPVDDAIGTEEYERLMASDSATIAKQFMQHHITEYNYPVSAALDSTTIISLNSKHHTFTQTKFDGFTYSAVNIPSTNGVMHKINGMSTFRDNLYDNIDNIKGCDAFKAYIQKYDEYYLDTRNSVIGPLVDGKQTYLDSVMKKRNNVISSLMSAKLEEEDSTYCMLFPNDKAWEDIYNKIHPCYRYIAKMDYMDLSKKTSVASSTQATTAKAEKAATTTTSILQDSLTCRNIVSNLVFSSSFEGNRALFGNGTLLPDDSIRTTTRRYLQNGNSILEHTTDIGVMSNGVTRVIDAVPFFSWQTYNPCIVTTRPAHTLKVTRLSTHNIPLDSLAGRDSLFSKVPPMFHQWLFPEKSRFFSYVAVDSADIDGTTGKPEFNFALNGVRSTTYHIYVITVPEQVIDAEATVKPYYLRFYLSWTDASNKQHYDVLPKGARTSSEITTADGKNSSTVTYVGNPGRVNVIDLGEFTFPACYYGLDAYPSLMMMHTKSYTTSSNRARYDQQMRVAGVYLIPKDYNDYWANLDNEQ